VQGAVDVAIARFARHAQPGLQLEKPPHSRDDRIRILPVDSRWHAVVLVPESGPTADTYCLVTVLPQDKANAYATSRRFSVNRALGVLEVRDEEAIQQLLPPADATRRQLFADVSAAELVRLGVDAQILPTVRRLTRETDLEALKQALPEAQYAALHALAGGMTVDEALAEAARLASGSAPPGRWTRTTWCPPWSTPPARSPSCPDRRILSSSWLTCSRRGARSCTRTSASAPGGVAGPISPGGHPT
jgi:hypothetical protein